MRTNTCPVNLSTRWPHSHSRGERFADGSAISRRKYRRGSLTDRFRPLSEIASGLETTVGRGY